MSANSVIQHTLISKSDSSDRHLPAPDRYCPCTQATEAEKPGIVSVADWYSQERVQAAPDHSGVAFLTLYAAHG